MNSNYLFEYINLFERVLSAAYQYKYHLPSVEHGIAYSPFFQSIERNDNGAPIIDEQTLIKQVLFELDINTMDVKTYNQCLWAAESYIRIQKETGFTFELIFLYLPIKKMYQYFDIYHEMDFSQIIEEFNRLYSEQSILSILVSNYKYSIKEISDISKISYETIYSLKQRKRDVKKANVESIIILSSILHVRVETLSEISFK